jgi:aconitate hydratase
MKSKNSFNTLSQLHVNSNSYQYFSLEKLATKFGPQIHQLPYSLKVLLENALRFEDGTLNSEESVQGFVDWLKNNGKTATEIGFMPSRVLMQDFTGVPAVVDLAAMRDALKKLGGNPENINPLIPVDLVIDHSVQVDSYGTENSFKDNVAIEMGRNKERYEFLRWGASAFNNFRVVPPGTGICHQINIEYLAKVIHAKGGYAFPDTLVGTDSHTTMVNALGVLGWGVGGIEAEAAMLGQPLPMVIPEVVGVELHGSLKNHINATDLVLTVTQMLRKANVVGKLVEFFGEGLKNLSLADRATIANMAPEYGATCGFFPIDDETIKYLELTNRSTDEIALVKAYAQEQGLWHNENNKTIYSQKLSLDLNTIETSVSGPKRPQDRISIKDVKDNFVQTITKDVNTEFIVPNLKDCSLKNGSVVIAAITSCTNTSNPYVMIGAGLIAKKIVEHGLKAKPWVKTSFAPGSQVVVDYLKEARLDSYMNQIGFNLVGYGCTTCIGNSGPLLKEIEETITTNNLQVASILSGNRNFEGRVHPLVKANYLASPLLVIAYAIAGTVNIDIENDVLGIAQDGKKVFLKDIWPTKEEINEIIRQSVKTKFFAEKYSNVFVGSPEWQELQVASNKTYDWKKSTYINHPPYFVDIKKELEPFKEIKQAKLLAGFGDSITTDHISPAGNISKKSPAAAYLLGEGVPYSDFNSYGARRGNHEVMMRGTFANIRIKNELCPGIEGGFAKSANNEIKSIYEVAMEYKNNVPLVIIAGKEYGTGSSRDWAAKGTALLGVKAVIAESFERIHRSNLVGMGVLPLKFLDGLTRHDLKLDGSETFDIILDESHLKPHQKIVCIINGTRKINLELQIYTDIEIEYIKHGTILHKVIRNELKHK